MRMKKELGSLNGLDIDLATAGHHICGHALILILAGWRKLRKFSESAS